MIFGVALEVFFVVVKRDLMRAAFFAMGASEQEIGRGQVGKSRDGLRGCFSRTASHIFKREQGFDETVVGVRICGVDGDRFFVVRQRAVGFVAQVLVHATKARMGDCEIGTQGDCILKGCFCAVGFFKAQIEQAHARVVRRRIRRGR